MNGPLRESRLVSLLEELLDACLDTIALGPGADGGIRGAAHLDYLRALERRGHELLAQASQEGNP